MHGTQLYCIVLTCDAIHSVVLYYTHCKVYRAGLSSCWLEPKGSSWARLARRQSQNWCFGLLELEQVMNFQADLNLGWRFWSNRPTGPIQSSSWIVCLCVCLSLFHMYILRPILPPLPEVRCPKFLEIQNPWGKVLERSGLRIEHFCWEVVWNRRVKKVFFLLIFTASGVKIGCINRTIFVLEHSILTLGALLT